MLKWAFNPKLRPNYTESESEDGDYASQPANEETGICGGGYPLFLHVYIFSVFKLNHK